MHKKPTIFTIRSNNGCGAFAWRFDQIQSILVNDIAQDDTERQFIAPHEDKYEIYVFFTQRVYVAGRGLVDRYSFRLTQSGHDVFDLDLTYLGRNRHILKIKLDEKTNRYFNVDHINGAAIVENRASDKLAKKSYSLLISQTTDTTDGFFRLETLSENEAKEYSAFLADFFDPDAL